MVTESLTLAAHRSCKSPARRVKHWTRKGILTAKTWESPGGRLYLDYDAAEVRGLREAMRPE